MPFAAAASFLFEHSHSGRLLPSAWKHAKGVDSPADWRRRPWSIGIAARAIAKFHFNPGRKFLGLFERRD
jgi:hypothetical protein